MQRSCVKQTAEITMNKRIAVHLGVIAFAVVALWVSAEAQRREALTVEKVTNNLWVIIGNGVNVEVMPTNDGVLLVDDKFAEDVPDIIAKVKTVSDKPIRCVLNTHQHVDHTGGNSAMIRAAQRLSAIRRLQCQWQHHRMGQDAGECIETRFRYSDPRTWRRSEEGRPREMASVAC